MKLNELTVGKLARVVNVRGGDMLRRRLLELGFVIGAIIRVENVSPLGKSFLINCQDTIFALRLNAVSLIEVEEIIVNKPLI